MNNDKNALGRYLSEIGHQSLLTDDEERDLARRIQLGDSRAMDRLLEANLTYVVSLARQYEGRGLATEDLVAEGNVGMLRAAAKYTADGRRFVAFAAPYIREAIEQAIEQQAGLYRVPRDAAHTAAERRRSRALSIDAPLGGSHELSLGHVIADPASPIPGTALERETLLAELRSLVGTLDEREQTVMRSLYGLGPEPKTMQETATAMGLRRERVRQIRNRAIRRICKQTRNSALRDYLKS